MESVMNLLNPNSQPPLDERLLLFECPICIETFRTSPQIHYGVSSCFRCQAFFRKAHKNSKAPNFICENYNKCQGTQRWKTRRKCQKCRLDICLKMGMKPEAISNFRGERTTKQVQTCPEGTSKISNPQNNLSNPINQPPLDEGLLLFECPICKDKLRSSPKIHYGGSSCFSCKAFFRRAHKNSKEPNFKCENDNKCQGTERWKAWRKCQKCRLNICLIIGMKPEAVLTDDQKKIRFRKSSQKKSDCGGNRKNYVESETDTELSNISFDDIRMSSPSTSGYSVDIEEEPITIRSIMNMLPKSLDDQLHEEATIENQIESSTEKDQSLFDAVSHTKATTNNFNIESYKNKDFFCEQCKLQFDKKIVYDMHLNIVHNKDIKIKSELVDDKNDIPDVNAVIMETFTGLAAEPLPRLPIEPLPRLPIEPLPKLPSEPLPRLLREPLPRLPQEPLPRLPSEPLPRLSLQSVTMLPTEPLPRLPKEPLSRFPTEPILKVPSEPLPRLPTEPLTMLPTVPLPRLPTETLPRLPSEPHYATCELCGYVPTTKNKSREKQDHLARIHFKDKIYKVIPKCRPYKCPESDCLYVGKDNQSILRHFTGKHDILKKC